MADPITPESIKTARQRLGLTQAEFAARIGVSTQAVSFWERGTRTPTGLYATAVRAAISDTAEVPAPDRRTADAAI